MAERTNYKNPPILSDEKGYHVWRNEIPMWQLVTDLDQKKEAFAVTLCLSGRAREAALEIKGGFPVMAEITHILAANIRRQFFFVITTAASTGCLVQNFQLICYSQQVNATSQYNDSGSSTCSKWPNDRMVAVFKHCWLLVQGKRSCRER